MTYQSSGLGIDEKKGMNDHAWVGYVVGFRDEGEKA